MKGTTHSIIGAATGFIVAQSVSASPSATVLLVGLGGISGLMPDMDIDGKLRNKITISHKVFRSIAQVIGFLMIVYSIYNGTNMERLYGIGIGTGIIALSYLIKQRHMLTMTGVAVLIGGISLQETWLILLSVFIIIASFVSHRSYTHSLLGIIFFGYIAQQFEQSIKIDGVFLACICGYVSHLVGDMAIFPFNRRGIKLFLPFSSKEI